MKEPSKRLPVDLARSRSGKRRGADSGASGPAARPAPVEPRERIVDCALELLAAGGGAAVTMRSVGARVGLHNSSLFHHFASKRAIVAAIRSRINGSLARRLEPLANDDPPTLERFVAVLQAVSDHYAAQRDEARCLMRLLLDPDDASTEDGARFTTALWAWLARAQAAGAIRRVHVGQAARNVLGILLLDAVWGGAGQRSPRDDERRRAELEAFVRGALAPPP